MEITLQMQVISGIEEGGFFQNKLRCWPYYHVKRVEGSGLRF